MEGTPYLKIDESQHGSLDAVADNASFRRGKHARYAGGCVLFVGVTAVLGLAPVKSSIGLLGLSSENSIGDSWRGLSACHKNTGGTCSLFGCSSHRGPTKCVNGQCICQEGYCSIDGECKPWGTCEIDTHYHCNFFDCKAMLGPTYCERTSFSVNHKCKCKPGWCAVGGACVENVTSVEAKVVKLDASHHEFPEPHSLARKALSCSGGGSRAAAICMGLLRALEFSGLMPQIDALAGVSGGAWATAPYMFSDQPLTKLLGLSTTPATLTMEELKKEPGTVGLTANVNIVHAIAHETASATVGPHQAWYTAIARFVLGPFGLEDKYTRMAASLEDVEDIKSRNPDLKDASFITPVPGRPKVFILTGTLIRPRQDNPTNPNAVATLQVSPDFTGSPYHIGNHRKVKYGDEKLVVGGGLIETFAFGGPPPNDQAKGGLVEVPAPARPMSLAFATAMSSNFYAGNYGGMEAMQREYWGIGHQAESMEIYQVGDGGLLDNNAMAPMLQRGVTKFIWHVPTQLVFDMKPDYCGGAVALGTTFNNSWCSDDISDKFGYGICGGGFFRCHNQFFAKEDYIPLLCKMKKTYANKEPLVLTHTLQTVANDYWKTEGGRTLEILLMYNTLAQPFMDALPQETQDEIKKGKDGAFPNFPMYDIFAEDGPVSGGSLNYEQINLLAAHTEFLVTSRLPMVQQFLSE